MKIMNKKISIIIGFLCFNGGFLHAMQDDKENVRVICDAIGKGDLQKIQQLVEAGVNVQSHTISLKNGTINMLGLAIHFAVELDLQEYVNIVQYLIEACKVDQDCVYKDHNGESQSVLQGVISLMFYGSLRDSANGFALFKYLIEKRGCGDGLEEIFIGGQPRINQYFSNVKNYYDAGTITTPWTVNYFCLAAFLELLDMKFLFQDKQCVLSPEERRSLIIGLHDRKKYKALDEVFSLFNVAEQDTKTGQDGKDGYLKNLPIDKKHLQQYFMQKKMLEEKEKQQAFEDVVFGWNQ